MALLSGTAGNDLLTGTAADDSIHGNLGADTLYGAEGNDYLSTGGWNPATQSWGDDAGDLLDGGEGNDTLVGNAGTDVLYGRGGNDQLQAGSGADTLYGGDGNDYLQTGRWDSAAQAWVDDAGDMLDGGEGDDWLNSNAGADTLLGGSGNDALDSGAGNDTLNGGTGNDYLRGGEGADLMRGGAGDDTFVVDDSGDVVSELPGEGVDRVESSVSFVLGADIEHLTLTGSGDVEGAGNGASNSLAGNAGANQILGGAGDDSLQGGLGADKLFGGDGNDYLSTGGWNPATQSWGDDAGDLLDGGEGDDRLYSYEGDDNLLAGSGNDTLDSGAGDDTLDGGVGNDNLQAGMGADKLYGGDGNDYLQTGRWDSAAQARVDDAGDMLDGGEGDDWLNSNAGADTLLGGSGNDALDSGAGNDSLDGGTGNDYLRGGEGADLMRGGAGDDTFVVDDPGDVVTELSGEGDDRVESSVSFVLGADIEHLTLTGSGDVDGAGNGASNSLAGNAGANQILGGAGDDSLQGGMGADKLYGGDGNDYLSTGGWNSATQSWGDDAGDLLDGGEGDDRLYSNAGADTLLAGNGNDTLDSGAGNDSLDGGGGDDNLQSGLGADTLYGGDGNDDLRTGRWDSTAQAWVDDAGDLVDGGDGDDTLSGSASADTLHGGGGNDDLQGGVGADKLYGGEGNDYLSTGSWSPIIQDWGDDAGDLLDGGEGNDNLRGSTGDDTLIGGEGNDTLDGGAGDDVYFIDDLGDTVYEQPDGGRDTAFIGVSGAKLNLANIENITYLNGALPMAYWVDALVVGTYWGPVRATPTVTYGFLSESTDSTFVPFSAADQARTAAALALWAQVTNVNFVQASNWQSANIRFGYFDIEWAGVAGYPNSGGWVPVTIDVSAVPYLATQDNWFHVLVHEIGHALGLKHPGNYNGSGPGTPPFLGAAEDGLDNSHMSYYGVTAGRAWSNSYNLTLRPFDIAAAQYIYGVNPGLNPGNTIYRYSQLAWPDMLIGDGGGTDVLDASDVAPQPPGFSGFDMTIDLRSGARIFAGAARDLITAPGQVSINYGTVIENAIGSAGRDYITGNEVDNVLTGLGGDDVLDGGSGADTLIGGAGSDVYDVNDLGDIVIELANEGTDLVRALVTRMLEANVENLTLSGSGDLGATGNALPNVLTGNAGANRLDGGGGADTLVGGPGDDIYEVDDSADVVTELADEGVDEVHAAASFTLSADVEQLLLNGSASIDGTGNALDNLLLGNTATNRLSGGAGDDTLDGGGGADALAGGAGDDVYEVDDPGDVVTELEDEGVDLVRAAVSRALGEHVESLTLTGVGDIDGTGNALANAIHGNSGANALRGEAGDDEIEGRNGDDLLDGGAGEDTLAGGDGNDVLVGGPGRDTLGGGTGSDAFRFGAVVDSLLAAPDVVTDFESTDRVEFVGIAGIGLAFDAFLYAGGIAATIDAINGHEAIANRVVFFTSGPDGFLYVKGAGTGKNFDGVLLELNGVTAVPSLGQLPGVRDLTAPTVFGFSPVDGAKTAALGVDVVVTFSEPIQSGAGTIVLRTAAGAVVETFDAAASGRVTVSGSTLTIDPTADLAFGMHYFVELPSGSVRDLAGNGFAGTASYDFATIEQPLARTGTAAAEVLLGGRGADTLDALAGNDILIGLAGDNALDGGDGLDTAWYVIDRAAYIVARSGSTITIAGPEGTDTLTSIERALFADGALAFDIDGNAGQTYRLYQAAFARQPDAPGLSFWIGVMDAGASLQTVAAQFIGSAEFISKYGASPSNEQFVTALYQNVLNRLPDAAGLAFWVDKLDTGALSRPEVLIGFSESVENRANVLPAIDNGIVYQPAAGTAGTPRADQLVGTLSADTFSALAGRDLLIGLGGNDNLNGGADLDTTGYGGTRNQYLVVYNPATGGITVTDGSGVDGIDTLAEIERLQFADKNLAFDIAGNAGQTYRLYQAAFARTPDTPGLSFWIGQMDSGAALLGVAGQFISSAEFTAKYGANPSNGDFVTLLYQNVLNRLPDQAGLDFWVNQLDAATISRPEVLIGFSESTENQMALIGVLQQGIEYLQVG